MKLLSELCLSSEFLIYLNATATLSRFPHVFFSYPMSTQRDSSHFVSPKFVTAALANGINTGPRQHFRLARRRRVSGSTCRPCSFKPSPPASVSARRLLPGLLYRIHPPCEWGGGHSNRNTPDYQDGKMVRNSLTDQKSMI